MLIAVAATFARRHLRVYTRDLLALVTGAHSSIITLECISSSYTTTHPLLRILEIGCQTDSILFNWRQILEIHQFSDFIHQRGVIWNGVIWSNLSKSVRHSKKTVTELFDIQIREFPAAWRWGPRDWLSTFKGDERRTSTCDKHQKMACTKMKLATGSCCCQIQKK